MMDFYTILDIIVWVMLAVVFYTMYKSPRHYSSVGDGSLVMLVAGFVFVGLSAYNGYWNDVAWWVAFNVYILLCFSRARIEVGEGEDREVYLRLRDGYMRLSDGAEVSLES